jgi:hypothetical protein
MTRQSGLDLTGADLYNGNGGIAQGQMCGQALITKLLKNTKALHGAVPLSQDPLLFHDDGSARCTSAVKLKKTKLHKSNLYENINISNDTESCSSDEVFAEAISSGSSSSLGRALDDLQTPTFVAQFDPMQPFAPHVHAASGPRKSGAAWSASLPAVLEEDSRDSQGENDSNHHGPSGIWRNLQNILTKSVPIEEDDEDSVQGPEEQVLLESDRIASPPSIPHSQAPHFQLDHQEWADSDEQREADPTFMNLFMRRDHKTKRSKEKLMRDAVDRRIQQVMKKELGERDEPPSEKAPLEDEEYHTFDMNRGATNAHDQTQQVENSTFNPFHRGASNAVTTPHAVHTQSVQPERHAMTPSHVSSQMQDLLNQQQATLKEMSLQNYHYRRELSECQDMFGQWRLEREQQRSIINDLVKEKEAYASEANFLRDQMFSMRLELETLRKETQFHAEFQKQRQSPFKTSSPRRQETRNCVVDQQDFSNQHRFYSRQDHQSLLKKDCSSQGLSSNQVPVPPPPPIAPPTQRPQQTAPRLDHIGATQPNKPFLVSKLKAAGTQTDPAKKHGRSVKFQDPPKSMEWTLFPNHLHDNRMMNTTIEVRNISNWAASNDHSKQSQPEAIATTMVVQVHPSDGDSEVDVYEEEPTPIAANGRAAIAADENYKETRSVYKHRLETIQRRRQQRVGRDDSGCTGIRGDGGDAGTPDKQKKRRSRPSAV